MITVIDMNNLMNAIGHATFKEAAREDDSIRFLNQRHSHVDIAAPKQKPEDLVIARTMDTILEINRIFGATITIAAFDYGSWRKSVLKEYKSGRGKYKKPEQIEIGKRIHEAIERMYEAMKAANMNVLRVYNAEGDDLIWAVVNRYGKSNRICMVTTDKDMNQCLSENVIRYARTQGKMFTLDATYLHMWDINSDTAARKFSKESGVKVHKIFQSYWTEILEDQKPIPNDPKWQLVYKAVRGDSSDSIPPGNPRVREKKLREAYETWKETGDAEPLIEIMNTPVISTLDSETVTENVKLNRKLIDLSRSPDEIRKAMQEEIEKMENRSIPVHWTINARRLMRIGRDSVSLQGMTDLRPFYTIRKPTEAS